MGKLLNGPNGRDSNNCSAVGSGRCVWEIEVTMILDVVKSEWNEVVKTGERVKDTLWYHYIADSETNARALFADRFRFQKDRIIGEPKFTALCTVDGEIELRHR